MKAGFFRGFVVLSFAMLCGCMGSFIPKSPPFQYHQLDYSYQKIDAPCKNLSSRILKIWPFHATTPFDGLEMVVEENKINLALSRTHQWIDKPGALLAEWIRKDIDRDGMFAGAFESIEISEETGMELGGVVERWSLVRADGSYSAKMETTITVWQKKPTRAIIFKKHYALEEPVGLFKDPDAFVRAMSRLATKISEDFRRELYRELDRRFCMDANDALQNERKRTEP